MSGTDRRSWLNGLLTQDVSRRPLEPRVEFALATTQKGKVLADVWLMGWNEVLYLSVPTASSAELMQHFEHHLVMEDAEIVKTDLETRVVLPVASAPLAPKNDAISEFYWPFRELNASLSLASPSDVLDALRLSEEEWTDHRIDCEMKAFGVDYDETYYPQEASLHPALSFDKGCYLGQEVVCMLELRGKVRRQVVLVEGEGRLESGARLYDQAGENTKEVGDIRSIHTSGTRAFALVQASSLAAPMWTKEGVRVRAVTMKKSD